jgi:hypothetical protein
MTNETFINESVLDQFERSLTMFREAVSAFDEQEWKKGDSDYQRPAGIAYHLIETIHFYTSNEHARLFPWGGAFGVDWETPDAEKLPNQQQILTYLDETWVVSKEWMNISDLSQEEKLYPGTGRTVLSKMGYLLRHTQHHTAELSLELTRRGFNAPEWR